MIDIKKYYYRNSHYYVCSYTRQYWTRLYAVAKRPLFKTRLCVFALISFAHIFCLLFIVFSSECMCCSSFEVLVLPTSSGSRCRWHLHCYCPLLRFQSCIYAAEWTTQVPRDFTAVVALTPNYSLERFYVLEPLESSLAHTLPVFPRALPVQD